MRVLAVVLVAACSSPPASPTPDAFEAPAGPTWDSVETISNDGQVISEHVTYRVGGLVVNGRVCRPADSARHPVAMYNHGGFGGLSMDPLVSLCEQTAKFGYVWIGSAYRGEDGSDGQIEVCLGEVDDVLAMLDLALAQPYADPAHAVMWGGSHGGCITLRALERGAPVRAAAALYPPSDIARVYNFWQTQIAASDPQSSLYQQLSAIVRAGAGGTPDAKPDAYAARSPAGFVAQLPAIPLFVVHGTADTLVPVTESCALAGSAALATYHLDSAQHVIATAPTGCSGGTWSAGPYPGPSWPGSRYLVAYDGLGHDESGTVFDAAEKDVAAFLIAKL